MFRTIPLVSRLAAAALAVLVGSAGAQTISSTNGHTQAGGVASVSFSVDFGPAPIDIAAIGFDFAFDPTWMMMVPHGTSETYQGAPVDLSAALAATGTYDTWIDAQGVHATWFALDSNLVPLPPLSLSGVGTMAVSFVTQSYDAPNMVIPVFMGVQFTDAYYNDLPPLTATAMVRIDPVPEPTSLALALAGLAGLAGFRLRGRRRA